MRRPFLPPAMTHPLLSLQYGAEFLSAFIRLPRAVQQEVETFARRYVEAPEASGFALEALEAPAHPDYRAVKLDAEPTKPGKTPHAGNGKSPTSPGGKPQPAPGPDIRLTR